MISSIRRAFSNHASPHPRTHRGEPSVADGKSVNHGGHRGTQRRFGPISVSSLEATISGEDVTGTFLYKAADVDEEFKNDTLIIDGYDDPIKAWIYIRLITGDGSPVKTGKTYPLD